MPDELPMADDIEIVDVNAENVDEEGFFCRRSMPDSEGNQRKQGWLKKRFREGLRLKILKRSNSPRGFIEYIPGKYTWRGIEAEGYMVIHCLWIVGRAKGKGFGSALLETCIGDARDEKMHGVAMVTSSGNWLAGGSFFARHGFEVCDSAPPSFELTALKFSNTAPPPRFKSSRHTALKYAEGLAVLRTDQCPYLDEAVRTVKNVATELGIGVHVADLRTRAQARNNPSPYGVFSVLYDGEVISYHPLTHKELLKRIAAARRLGEPTASK